MKAILKTLNLGIHYIVGQMDAQTETFIIKDK